MVNVERQSHGPVFKIRHTYLDTLMRFPQPSPRQIDPAHTD